MSDTSKALLYTIDLEHLSALGQNVSLLNVENKSWLSDFLKDANSVQVYHHDKSKYDRYVDTAYCVLNDADKLNDNADIVLLTLPKQKLHAQYLIALALRKLNTDGVLIVSGGNKEGGSLISKYCKQLGTSFEIYSKYKSKTARINNSCDVDEELVDVWFEQGEITDFTSDDKTFKTIPGIFGWNKIDVGSALLASELPNDLTGSGADLGCGYGYLSQHILNGNAQDVSLLCADYDYRAIQSCRLNTQDHNKQCEYIWHDLASPLEEAHSGRYDWVVMNPPFHVDKKVDVDLGIRFIQRANELLKDGGKLYMVANITLAYEKYLHEKFSSVKSVNNQNGFKVIFAVK